MDFTEVLRVAEAAALEASFAIKEAREKSFQISFKGSSRDLVTTADLQANEIILAKIQEYFPSHRIFSEELGARPSTQEEYNDPLWIIDPIDGTTNFAYGHLHVGCSIAFAYQGEVKVGVVNAPFYGELYTAIKGEGAFCNGKKISVGTTSSLLQALVCTGFPYERDVLEPLVARVQAVLSECRDLRRLGACSVDMCWVAAGRLDAYYESVAPWDMAAGALIAKEAGAVVGNLLAHHKASSIPADLWSEDLLVANSALYSSLEKLLLGNEESVYRQSKAL